MHNDEKNSITGEQKFATAMLEAMIDGVVIVDINGNIIQCNNAYAKMHGFKTCEEMKGINLRGLVSEKDVQRTMNVVKKTYEADSIVNFECTAKDKTGKEFPVMVNASVLKDEKGKVIGSIGVVRDITEIKEAEVVLVESEEKYRHLFENSQVGMYRSRIDGSAILDVNKKWMEIFGYSKEEILGKPSSVIWANPEKREPFTQQLKEKGVLINYEMDLLTKGGGIRSCLVSASIFSDKGIIEGTIVDITERKKMEKELKKKMHDLEIFHKAAVGRELKMEELKKEIAALKIEISSLRVK